MGEHIDNISRATGKVGRRDDAKILRNLKREDTNFGAKGGTLEDKFDNFMKTVNDRIARKDKV